MRWYVRTFHSRTGVWNGSAGFSGYTQAAEYAHNHTLSYPGSRAEVWPNGWQETGG